MAYSSQIYGDRGSLKYIGIHKLGRVAHFHYYECQHCRTDYPVIDDRIMCNGREISDCSCEGSKPCANTRP